MKLGRLPRIHNPAVPHMSALLAGKSVTVAPASVDYSVGMPSDVGMMLNDTLGDCTCAAVYHAFQVWTHNSAPPMRTQGNGDVELLYSEACGYVPGNPATDQGGIEQNVLTYLVKTGAPMGPKLVDNTYARNKIAAFIEVDPRNTNDVKNTIYQCGVSYIGLQVPAYLMQSTPPVVWDIDPSANNSIIGGHAVILCGYDSTGVKLISWGQFYTMTWAFFNQFVDETYAIAEKEWVATTGKTPAGMTLLQLEQQMKAL